VIDEPDRPLLQVVRGEPDDAELAALTVVVASMAAAASQAITQPAHTPWSDPRAMVRRPTHHGPGAWRTSGLPV
jgi:hypothetical protein